MARIRTIKPEFWIDERVGECSPTARLLFIATWNFADDNGNLERSAKQLKAQAMPYDDVDCEALLVELIQLGLLREYTSNGHKYLHVSGFLKHQKIEKKSAARHPLPDSSPTTTQPVGSVREVEVEGKGNGSGGFSSTDTSRYVCEEMGLAGREMMWLAKDCIDLAMKSQKIEAQAAATLIVERWREYDTDDRPFKVGKDKFLKQCMIDPLKWRTENGNGKFSVFS